MAGARKTIGIIGGLGPESTILYYRQITRGYTERFGDFAFPEIVIHSLRFQSVIDAGYDAPEIVLRSLQRLERAGAEFAIAACNSIHAVHARVAPRSPIPWLSISESAADRVAADGYERVGLLGTVFTMRSDFYRKALADHEIEPLLPGPRDEEVVNDIIYEEMVRGIVNPASRDRVLRVIDDLVHRGAEAVILGCTELPLLIRQEHTDTPVFDAGAIHARRALELAVGDEALSREHHR